MNLIDRVVNRFAAMAPQALIASKALRKCAKDVASFFDRSMGVKGWTANKVSSLHNGNVYLSWTGPLSSSVSVEVSWTYAQETEFMLKWETRYIDNGQSENGWEYVTNVSADDLAQLQVFFPASLQKKLKEAFNPDTSPGAATKKLSAFIGGMVEVITKGADDYRDHAKKLDDLAETVKKIAANPDKDVMETFEALTRAVWLASQRPTISVNLPTKQEIEKEYRKSKVGYFAHVR